MKKITAFFLSALAMILFVQCGNSSVDQLVSDSNSRKYHFRIDEQSSLTEQVMDSLHAKHAGAI